MEQNLDPRSEQKQQAKRRAAVALLDQSDKDGRDLAQLKRRVAVKLLDRNAD